MNTFYPLNNNGFKWTIDDNIYFKGYFFDSSNNLLKENEAITFFKNTTNIQHFIKKLNAINGMYSIVIINDNYCFVSCDASRIFPIFYTKYNNNLFLSDNILKLKDKTNSTFNIEGQKSFQGFGYTIGKSTMLKNIYQLQSSEYLAFNNSKIENKGFHFSYAVKEYSTLPTENLKSIAYNSFQKSFDRLYQSLQGKTAIIPLSGGFDSRLIATMLKSHNYKNVICYTYGKKGNSDMILSKKVAKALGFKWYFIEYTDKLINGFINNKLFINYCNSIFNYSSMLFLQEYFAVKYLKENMLIPENSIFISGHDGGALAGGYHVKSIPLSLKHEEISKYIYNSYIYAKNNKSEKAKCIKTIEDCILNFNNCLTKNTPQSIQEDYIFKEFTSKVSINSAKVYEFFGYEHRLPFWDIELLSTFKKIPIEKRINKVLYRSLISEFYKPYNINFKDELNPSLFQIKLQNFKNLIKELFPYFIIKNRLLKNDWMNAEKMTNELRESMIENKLSYNLKIKYFNEVNIQWYIYFCKGLIKK